LIQLEKKKLIRKKQAQTGFKKMGNIGMYSTEESQSLSESLTHGQKHQSLRSDSLLLKEQNVPSMHTQLRISTNNNKKKKLKKKGARVAHRPP
jgi:hypothetical protein